MTKRTILRLTALALGAGALLGGAVGVLEAHLRAPAKVTEGTSIAPPATDRRLDDARRLALEPPRGGSAVDAQIVQLQRGVQKSPRKVDFWVALGRAWVSKARMTSDPGYYVNAEACADVVLADKPGDRLAEGIKALVLLNGHRFEEARALAASVVARRPDDVLARGALSDALLELGRVDEAAAEAQAMMDTKPNLPSYSRAAYLRWLRGDAAGAKVLAREALDAGKDPRDPEPFAWQVVQTATMFWHEGDYEGADAGFDRALAWMKDYPPALVGKGRVAMARGDAAAAVPLLARALERAPLAETAWLLGDARAAAGDAEGARAAWALVEKEGRGGDLRTLALFWATKATHIEDAVRLAEEERRTRRDPYTEDTLAWALHRSGRDADARVAAERATQYGTKDARLMFHLGAIRIALGEGVEGRALIAEALRLNPQFDATGADEARRLVGETHARLGVP